MRLLRSALKGGRIAKLYHNWRRKVSEWSIRTDAVQDLDRGITEGLIPRLKKELGRLHTRDRHDAPNYKEYMATILAHIETLVGTSVLIEGVDGMGWNLSSPTPQGNNKINSPLSATPQGNNKINSPLSATPGLYLIHDISIKLQHPY